MTHGGLEQQIPPPGSGHHVRPPRLIISPHNEDRSWINDGFRTDRLFHDRIPLRLDEPPRRFYVPDSFLPEDLSGRLPIRSSICSKMSKPLSLSSLSIQKVWSYLLKILVAVDSGVRGPFHNRGHKVQAGKELTAWSTADCRDNPGGAPATGLFAQSCGQEGSC